MSLRCLCATGLQSYSNPWSTRVRGIGLLDVQRNGHRRSPIHRIWRGLLIGVVRVFTRAPGCSYARSFVNRLYRLRRVWHLREDLDHDVRCFPTALRCVVTEYKSSPHRRKTSDTCSKRRATNCRLVKCESSQTHKSTQNDENPNRRRKMPLVRNGRGRGPRRTPESRTS